MDIGERGGWRTRFSRGAAEWGEGKKSGEVKNRKQGKSLNDMIDSGEVKDSNVSIRVKWSRNGYKEEADGRKERQTLRAEGAKSNQESLRKWDFANASYFLT